MPNEATKKAFHKEVLVVDPVRSVVKRVYEMARTTPKRDKAPIIGTGESMGTNVHIHDLTDLFSLFVKGALEGNELLRGPES
ncbi:hypothetical protein PENANT_c024G08023 [Penicillium antarcticum]|uniref:Uncharacterized protein n=1 Tax=Penicillium antarcticum TaxID=416450 RepID=A0A1V6PXT8_9EURO|nr:hypothetical protein PENANT_c024G08023 [Penicillium antarcticum]